MTKKSKLFLMEIGSFISMLLPLTIWVIVHWDDYTRTPASGFALCIGGVLSIVFFLLLIKGKLKMPERQITTFLIVFILAWCMEPILYDLKMLALMALIGQAINTILFEYRIKRLREEMFMQKSADITTKTMLEAMNKK